MRVLTLTITLLWRILMEQIDYTLIKAMAELYGTPYYMMFPAIYKNNVNNFKQAFLERYEKIIIGYSFKTNYVPALGKLAKEIGCYAEVVSRMEYDLAKKLGFKNIIFNGPIKTKETLVKAINDNAIINIDSMYEVDIICELNIEKPIKIGLRTNIDLFDENGVSKIQNGLRVGRFGLTKNDLDCAINKLKEKNIKIISLHGHTSSSDRAVLNYQLITEQMLDVCESFNLKDLEYFDIGGGFFGAAPEGLNVENKPKYTDYSELVTNIVLNNKWFKKHKPYIVIEPGVSVVANVFSYVSMLYQKKYIANTNFISTDGTVFDVKPTLHSNNLPFKVVMQNPSPYTKKVNIVGSTCMEKDIILNQVDVPENVSFGDFLLINGVGAYTIALTPTFINYLSPIISIHNGTKELVRRRQEINDVTQLYKI